MRNQKGFTLIELVVVIVILGVLAAVAVPKFINMKDEAAQAAVDGMAGSLSSAVAINYAARSLNVAKGSAVADCTDAAALLSGGLDASYTITAAAVAVDTAVTCTLTGENTKTATFVAIGIL